MPILIENIFARQVIDSRGFPALEVEILLNNGVGSFSSVPLGKSVGVFETHRLRDNDSNYIFSKSVKKAISNINNIISKELIGFCPFEQTMIDCILCELDKTDNFSNLGANTVFAVSLAVLEVSAKARGLELYQYIGGINANKIPIPMVNLINGDINTTNNLKFQEFMIVPLKAKTFSEAVKISSEIFNELKNILKQKECFICTGDEGGYSIQNINEIEALNLLVQAINKTSYSIEDVKIAIDVASNEFYTSPDYNFNNKKYSNADMIGYYTYLLNKYPIISIEDPLASSDLNGWKVITEMMSDKTMLVGDDLFTTNYWRLINGVKSNIANAILIKPNQIGTISQVFSCVNLAKKMGYKTIMSHRNRETENTSMVDLAVGLGCDYIKIGSVSRGERTAKYNRLLRIEEKIKKCSRFL